ncbi:MAG: hypothetical protein COZ85_03770 [Candidatus Moranbacteria bacterium CG_4_8_14_3_um_filter_34_16]|nr:MAG: hypothetical protein COT31_03520 [Candidatus Moranbacteria bacterium CG08_land_8_20_14_0_20_34_16]PIW94703.1 MAG: hypothetical protein COZ85_03770 [Candidatus Moranbacteria bacterium CG_4_8_14_3_um_filter_34_16]PJA89174.1 MAG: hypothetical protein CO138_01875 [Candidatus Moranbacteria bacterium CG_4_9_14_3_um_filter_33_15]
MLEKGFVKKSVGTLTLGEKLAKIRKDKRLSLNEVSRLTGVQTKYLEFLEWGEFEKLPADVYVKGFLRSYADSFQLDEESLLKLYEKEKGIKKNLKTKKPSKKIKPLEISSFVLTPAKVSVLAIVGLVLLGIFFLYREVGNFAESPRLIILTPQDNNATKNNVISVEGITDKDATVFLNNQAILVNDEGKFKENLTLREGVNYINIKSVSKFEKTAEKTISIFFENQNSFEQKNSENDEKEKIVQNEEIKLEIRVEPGPVWLKIETDGSLAFSGTMFSGAIQTFKAKEKIVVSSGKANATFVNFNGEDLGTLGEDAGMVKEKVFSKNQSTN